MHKVRLHLLVANQNDNIVREAVTDSIAAPGGLSRLYEQLSAISGEAAAAFAWLASIVKDYSGIFKHAIFLLIFSSFCL